MKAKTLSTPRHSEGASPADTGTLPWGSRAEPHDHRLLVLHEWSGQTYFTALDALARRPGGPGIEYREIMCIRQLAVGFAHRKRRLVRRAIENFFFFFKSFSLRDRTVIIGLAPCDKALLFWLHLLRHNRVIYHTSWTDWSGSHFPRHTPLFDKLVRQKWRSFVEDPRVSIVSILPESKQAILAHYKKDPAAFHVIPHAVDSSVFRPAEKKRENRLRVAYVGRLSTVKGIDVLAEIIRKSDQNKFWFDVVGEGPEIWRLQPLMGKPNLRYRGYMGVKEDIARVLRACDVFIMPSISEQFGIALIEGMACGVVPIASTGLVPKDLVRDGENGYVIKREAEAFMAALERLQQDRELLASLRAKALERVREFSLPLIMDEWSRLLGAQISGIPHPSAS